MPRHGLRSVLTGGFQVLALGAVLGVRPAAQILSPKPAAAEHVIVSAGADPESVGPGGKAALWIEVTPKANIHVYAAGAKGFQPITIFAAKVAGVTLGRPTYPRSEPFVSPGTTDPVPVYSKPFRVVQPVTIARDAKSGQILDIAGSLTYESCDDRLCYPASTVPVSWRVTVR